MAIFQHMIERREPLKIKSYIEYLISVREVRRKLLLMKVTIPI